MLSYTVLVLQWLCTEPLDVSYRCSDFCEKHSLKRLYSPTTWGRVEASRSSMMVPFSIQVLSSNRLCKESVATWGLLQRSPPFSTFSSNLIHLKKMQEHESQALNCASQLSHLNPSTANLLNKTTSYMSWHLTVDAALKQNCLQQ